MQINNLLYNRCKSITTQISDGEHAALDVLCAVCSREDLSLWKRAKEQKIQVLSSEVKIYIHARQTKSVGYMPFKVTIRYVHMFK